MTVVCSTVPEFLVAILPVLLGHVHGEVGVPQQLFTGRAGVPNRIPMLTVATTSFDPRETGWRNAVSMFSAT